MRRNFLPLIVAVIVLSCLVGCNKKPPRQYQMVQNMSDGKQIVEKFEADNDTIALNKFLDRMSDIVAINMTESDSTAADIESMFVISPEGDTLNTNPELMHAIEKQFK